MSLTVRVVAPIGRDAELIVAVLRRHGITAEACPDALALISSAARNPLGPLLIAEESLMSAVQRDLGELVHHQPAWSDFPILILTTGGRTTLRTQELEAGRANLGSPVLLERPIRPETLVSSVRAAVRARKRQYEVRDAMAERDRALDELHKEGETLRNSEERFRRLIESASIGIIISDLHGCISYANPALLLLTGYSAEDVQRGRLRGDELTPAEFAELDRRATAQFLATGTCEPYQKAYRARDGSLVPLLVGGTVLPSTENDQPDSVQVAIFLTDLTSQKKAEAALIQSEKLAAVGRLAASISHEINNPLEAVTNLLFLLKNEGNISNTANEYLSAAEHQLTRMSQIVNQTLRFHRQSTAPRAVTAEELIDPVIALYQGRLLNSDIQVAYKCRRPDPVICYDGDIRQVLNNIVGNAIDSMRAGGRLTIRARNATQMHTGIRGMRITIADTGHGMSQEIRSRIFEAFYTTRGDSGTGLGLWISHGIVEKHHGVLTVKSSDHPGKTGSVFSLFLPLYIAPAS